VTEDRRDQEFGLEGPKNRAEIETPKA